MIPKFFEERIRGIVLYKVAWARADNDLRDDLMQEAYCAFLSAGSVPASSGQYHKHWVKVKADVAAAVNRITNRLYDAEMSLDAIHEKAREDAGDNPNFVTASTEGIADDMPTWIPSEPSERMHMILVCQKVIDSGGTVQRNPESRGWQALVNAAGQRINVGTFESVPKARAAIRAVCRIVQEWCSPINLDGSDEGGTAKEFMMLHSVGFPKPLLGDPLDALLFLEEYAERIKRGHRYYVESVDTDTRRKIRRQQCVLA